MDSLIYNIVLRTPVGYRIGTLMIEIENHNVRGQIIVADTEGRYIGEMDNNWNLSVKGELPLGADILAFHGKGKLSAYAVHMSMISGEDTYELDGTSKR